MTKKLGQGPAFPVPSNAARLGMKTRMHIASIIMAQLAGARMTADIAGERETPSDAELSMMAWRAADAFLATED